MVAKKRPVARLPRGITVYQDGASWRVRLAPCFTHGKAVKKRFETLAAARTWIDQQKAAQHQIHAAELTPAQLADAKIALDTLAGRGTLAAAAAFYAKHHRRPDETKSLAEAFGLFIVAKEKKGLRKRSLQAYKDTLTSFTEDHPKLTVAEVSREDVEEWLDEGEWASPTILHHQVNLSVFFNWCLGQKWLAAAPTEDIEKPTVDDKPPGILTVAQLADILNTAIQNSEFQALVPSIAIGAFAGLRTSELAQLRWEEIDLEEKTIEVTAAKSKTRQRRIVSMADNLCSWLKPFVQAEGRIWPPNRRKLFPALLPVAGIAEWPKNALRHSFASYHLAHYQDAGKTAHQLGHRDSQMLFAHYRELVKPAAAAKYWKIALPEGRKVVRIRWAA